MNFSKFHDDFVRENPWAQDMFWGISNKLGILVFALRVRKGITQEELAELAGVDDKVIHRAEGGSSDLTVKMYENLLMVLGLSREELNDLIEFK